MRWRSANNSRRKAERRHRLMAHRRACAACGYSWTWNDSYPATLAITTLRLVVTP